MKILILNGPNLNLLGKREPEMYGHQTLNEIFESLLNRFPWHQLTLKQSNHEGQLIDILHQADEEFDAIIFNPGAYAHTSVALADAVRSISKPVIEVHLSNIYARESYRSTSYIAAVAAGIISGFGAEGYALAVTAAESLA